VNYHNQAGVEWAEGRPQADKPETTKAPENMSVERSTPAYYLEDEGNEGDTLSGPVLIGKSSKLALPESRRGIARLVIGLAVPVVIEQSLLYLVGLSDTLLAGRYLSEDYLAGVTVSSYLLWVVGSLLTIVSVGATALVARMTGSGDTPAAARICQQAILLATAMGTAILIAGWLCSPSIVHSMNLSGTSADAAVKFMRIVLLVTPLLACTAAGVACLRGAGDTRSGMWVMILVNLLNITFSWGLVRGFGPLPNMGFAGIATGTAIAEGIGGLVVLAVLAKGRSGLFLSWKGLFPSRHDIARIMRISLPAAGESLTNSGCQLWFLSLINRLGPISTAAHGVAIRCEALAFLSVSAFAVAASTLTGQYLGAGRPDLARRAARTSWYLGMAGLSVIGLSLYINAEWFFDLFLGGNKPLVLLEGAPVLRIVAFAMPALATINVLNGSLRGAGDTRWPWAIVLFGYLCVRMPLTYWLVTPELEGGLGWGLRGAWIAMLCDLCTRGTLVAARFLQGGWSKIKV
jgi:putative MATE family efflux protein